MAGDKGDNYETISNIEVKYLKDNEGKIISPVVSSESVFCPGEDAMLKDKINAIDSKLVAASQSKAGFMSAADKAKLDGITASADSVSFTRSLAAGTKVGDLTINGTTTSLYAPSNTVRSFTVASVRIQDLNNNQWLSGKGSYQWYWAAPSGYTGTGMVTWRCTAGNWRVDGAYWANNYLYCDIYVDSSNQPCERGGITFYALFYK